MEPYRILPGRQGDGGGEIAPAFGLVHFGIVGSGDGPGVGSDLAAFKVVVGTPPLAVVGVIGALAGQQAHGPQLAANAGSDLDGGKLGLAAILSAELEMQLAVCGGLD